MELLFTTAPFVLIEFIKIPIPASSVLDTPMLVVAEDRLLMEL